MLLGLALNGNCTSATAATSQAMTPTATLTTNKPTSVICTKSIKACTTPDLRSDDHGKSDRYG
jgi:hypothetical protein